MEIERPEALLASLQTTRSELEAVLSQVSALSPSSAIVLIEDPVMRPAFNRAYQLRAQLLVDFSEIKGSIKHALKQEAELLDWTLQGLSNMLSHSPQRAEKEKILTDSLSFWTKLREKLKAYQICVEDEVDEAKQMELTKALDLAYYWAVSLFSELSHSHKLKSPVSGEGVWLKEDWQVFETGVHKSLPHVELTFDWSPKMHPQVDTFANLIEAIDQFESLREPALESIDVVIDSDVSPERIAAFFAELSAAYALISDGDELIIREGKVPVQEEVFV